MSDKSPALPRPGEASTSKPPSPGPGPTTTSRKRKERESDTDLDASQRAAPLAPGSSTHSAGSPTGESTTTHNDPREKTVAAKKEVGTPVPATSGRPDEYEAGRVVCEACGCSVSFRDDASGGFTLKHWDAHKNACPAAQQRRPGASSASSSPPVVTSIKNEAAPLSPIIQHANPPSGSFFSQNDGNHVLSASNPKRRRAKRTEEERIEYLRTDPYVAQYEPYRVLCASCDKWIRLRPNSTFCSIPWDAHRKSCLAKKVTAKNPYALSERTALFSKDPDVRKFDPERLLCNLCDNWLPLPPDDHLGAVQLWLAHRAECGRRGAHPHHSMGEGSVDEATGGERGQVEGVMMTANESNGDEGVEDVKEKVEEGITENTSAPRSPSSTSAHPTRFPPISPPRPSTAHPDRAAGPSEHTDAPQPSSNTKDPQRTADGHPPRAPTHTAHPSRDHHHPPAHPHSQGALMTPLTYAPSHESRRRNAEQRAATLRADGLIGRVEPNRVFCRLCEKWVQLRQDSSYCAYPWVQHRGKCLRRSERRSMKAAENQQPRAGPSNNNNSGNAPPPFARRLHSGSISHHAPPFPVHPSSAAASARYHSQRDLAFRVGGQRGHTNGSGHANSNTNGNGNGGGAGGRYHTHPSAEEDELLSDDGRGAPLSDTDSGSMDSEDGGSAHPRAGNAMRERERERRALRQLEMERQRGGHRGPSGAHASGAGMPGGASRGISGKPWGGSLAGGGAPGGGAGAGAGAGTSEDVDMDADADADADADMGEGEWVEDADGVMVLASSLAAAPLAMPLPTSLPGPAPSRRARVPIPASLDVPDGRRHFIALSLAHLFATSYAHDDIPVSSLVTYLNAAVPADKYEDFDTGEVAKAVGVLAGRGRVVFEGDVIRAA